MKAVILSLLVSSACCCGVLPTRAAYAQEAAELSTSPSLRFEQWAKEVNARTVRRLGKPEATQIEPDLLQAKEVLLKRLRQEKWTTDTSILNIVQSWMEYESPRPNQDGRRDAQGLLFPVTIASIEELAPLLLLRDRPLVLSRLYSMKGTFFSFDRKYSEAARAFENAVSSIAPLASESELVRLGNSVELASLISKTDAKKADALYRDVLRNPWFFIADEGTKKRLRILQTSAGEAIIELHRGDAKALEGLYFVTSAVGELKPKLDAAVETAKRIQPAKK